MRLRTCRKTVLTAPHGAGRRKQSDSLLSGMLSVLGRPKHVMPLLHGFRPFPLEPVERGECSNVELPICLSSDYASFCLVPSCATCFAVCDFQGLKSSSSTSKAAGALR